MRILLILFLVITTNIISCEKEEEETGIDPFLEEVLSLVNDVRREGCNCGDQYFPPANALAWDTELAKAAQMHARDMAENDFFSHIGSDGSNAGDRIAEQGYNWSTYGENIAYGYTSPEAVVDAWVNSPGHCQNMLNESFTELGIGYYAEGNYWVQVFATPQ